MSEVPRTVLDASALLAFLQNEPGALTVTGVLAGGAVISAVNWAEALTKLADLGKTPDIVAADLTGLGVLGRSLLVYPVDDAMAREIARLRPMTRALGLSLGDRACLALGKLLGAPVLTADRAWSKLSLPIRIQTVR